MTGEEQKRIEFRGGPILSVLPLAIFILCTLLLVIFGAPAVEGMILAAMLGISIGMLFARDFAGYSERIFSLMANRTSTVAVVCWLWAGAFSGILAGSGLVEAIVWVGWKLNLNGAWFTLTVFISSALFATSVGTGLGTIVGFTAVMYPAGIVLGANPAALLGAIFSGAAFGDNLAPISDTTIVSAATQETDVGGVVRATGSGDACPDWPRCRGELLPPLESAVLIESSHRLLASVVGLLIVATAVVAWRERRRAPVLFSGAAA
ncbi:hypothetical protein IH824_14915, partial [candidate division KSB1 bacterium]|nr:hypothetical protein [candidate division KSB1 bacterium]